MGSSCCKGSDEKKNPMMPKAKEEPSKPDTNEEQPKSNVEEETFDKLERPAHTSPAASKRKEENDSEPYVGIFDTDRPILSSFRDDGKTLVAISPLARALNKLALDLYSKMCSRNPNKSIVISPFSIALGLATAETGSSGKTRSEIQQLIGSGKTPEFGPERHQYGVLQEEILKIQKTDGEYRIANALFHDDLVNVREAFVKKVKEWFKTDVKQVSFEIDPEKARQRINRWVSDKTAGKIPQFYGPDGLKPDAALILINAAYLKMDWKNCFKLEDTQQKIFYRFGGKEEQKVSFMCRYDDKIEFYYAARKTLRVVELPYKGDAMSMYIVLPRRRDGIKDLETKLNVDRLISQFKSTMSCRVNLQIPKFSLRHVEPLLPIFSKMGFQTFNEFKQMTADSVEISDAIHMADIKVDENGTEEPKNQKPVRICSGSTALAEVITTFNFIADHPFLFFVVHKPTWSIVFMGKVNSVDKVD